MKKIYLCITSLTFCFGLMAQDGLGFNPEIDVNFQTIEEIQVSQSPVKTQILFSGALDTVTYLDSYGDSAGFTTARDCNDFIGITPDGDDYWMSVNHETTDLSTELGDGGGMTSFKVHLNDEGIFELVETKLEDGREGIHHNVDFINTVGNTWTNCGGITSPDGRIWTAEEYPINESLGQGNEDVSSFLSDTGDVIIGDGYILPFTNDSTQLFAGERIKKFESQGWMVEIDPKTAKAIRKQYNWGRMSFEAGAMTEDMTTVYLTEDERPGLFTKFVADIAGDFTEGTLYVYKQDADGANWLEVPDDSLEDMIKLKEWAWENGATYFIRLEWITIIDDKVYFSETGFDNVTSKKSWQLAISAGSVDQIANHHIEKAASQKHHDSDGNETTVEGTQFVTNDTSHYYDFYGRVLVYDPAADTVQPFLEGGPHFSSNQSQYMADYPTKHLSNPDGLSKITINGSNYLIICEDLNGVTYNRIPCDAAGFVCEMYLLDMSIENPTVDDLIRIFAGPNGAELTGGNGTSDGKTILVDIQHPYSSNNYPYNLASTAAFTGWDNLSDISSINFEVSFANDSTAQLTDATEIYDQILFMAEVDTVSYVNSYGEFEGFAPARNNHDFIGISPDGDDYWLSINHESSQYNEQLGNGGGMTTFKVSRDATNDTLIVLETTIGDRTAHFHTVDFANTVGETWTNCGGITAPDGRIWTAEEYPVIESWGQGNADVMSFLSDTGDVIIGEGIVIPFKNDSAQLFEGSRLKRYENQGWMVEIDPKSAKAIRKQYNWGRMSFEAGTISNDMKTVYLSEDERPGLFTKFVATTAGDFTDGTLYVYKQDKEGENWLEVPDNLETKTKLKDWAWENGATYFIRLEWIKEIDGKIYISETGYDNVCKMDAWIAAISAGSVDQVIYHHQIRAAELGTSLDTVGNDDEPYYDYYGRILVYDPVTDTIKPYLSGGPEYDLEESQLEADYPSKHLSNPDGMGVINIHGRNYMIINEDLIGATYNRLPSDAAGWTCEMYLLDMTIENPTVDDLTRIFVGPDGAELTGALGTPDGSAIMVSVQHPYTTNNAPYNTAVTVALTGFDYIANTTNEILSFDFEGLDPVVTGEIADSNITLVVPKLTDITSLTPSIVISDSASVVPASGIEQDFSTPVSYLVTSEFGDSKEYLVNVSVNTTSSINEITNSKDDFEIYPNPATRYLNFNDTYSVAIYNATGKLVKEKEKTTSINISELEAGIYFIKNDFGSVKRLVIK